ncbi:MAG: thiamine-phosphate kinase [Chloroflexi bacterium]|nr:thiamine-phosphate kinase [Chloroflexota bacterium]
MSGATVRDLGEFGLIDRVARLLVQVGVDPLRPPTEGEIEIGDDAALWQPTPGVSEVLTTDALVEGVHFRERTTSWYDLGWKALAQNISDIAAMAARPRRAFVTVGLRGETLVDDVVALYEGMAALARRDGVAIVGGDTVSSPFTLLSISVVGELGGPGLRRAAGLPGDLLAVTGALGGSAAGLALLEAGAALVEGAGERRWNLEEAALIGIHRRPLPRVAEGLTIAAAGVRCGMDLSDGLLGDAGKLAYASGLAARIEWERLPVSPALVARFPHEARGWALGGGEDFELLIAGPRATIERADTELAAAGLERLTVVGRLEAGRPGHVIVADASGEPMTPPRSSWDHFRSGRAD